MSWRVVVTIACVRIPEDELYIAVTVRPMPSPYLSAFHNDHTRTSEMAGTSAAATSIIEKSILPPLLTLTFMGWSHVRRLNDRRLGQSSKRKIPTRDDTLVANSHLLVIILSSSSSWLLIVAVDTDFASLCCPADCPASVLEDSLAYAQHVKPACQP